MHHCYSEQLIEMVQIIEEDFEINELKIFKSLKIKKNGTPQKKNQYEQQINRREDNAVSRSLLNNRFLKLPGRCELI